MKKTFRIIFIYLGVLLLASVAAVVFCAAFLFFYREGDIFGFQYISIKEDIYAKEDEDMSLIQGIEVCSETFDVAIKITPSVDEVMGAMRVRVFGFTKDSKAHTGLDMEYDENTGYAVFNAKQPSGWLNKNGSYLEIAIPERLATTGLDLVINTKKGKIQIGDKKESLSLGYLFIKTNKGKAKLSNINIDTNIDIEIGRGSFTIDDQCVSQGVDFNLKVESGTIDLSRFDVEKFKIDTVYINSIKTGYIGIRSVDRVITNGNIQGGGALYIAKVNFIDFSSLDTNVQIGNILGSDACRINIEGYGDVSINFANCELIVDGYNGDVKIGTIMGSSVLKTNKGNISMSNALKMVSAISNKGNINIAFDENALDYSDIEKENRAVVASTNDGHIRVRGLQYGNIIANKSGKITLEYDKIIGNNIIKSNSGMIDILVPSPTEESAPNEYAFNLKVDSKVQSDIKVGVAGSLGKVDYTDSGFKVFNNIYNSASSTPNTLEIYSEFALIKIRSRDLVKY